MVVGQVNLHPELGKDLCALFITLVWGMKKLERTIPQIMAILDEAGENISLKIGIPGIFGGALDTTSSPSTTPDKPPKLSEFMAFASAFDGIK